MQQSLDDLRQLLASLLGERRLTHSLAVAESAKALALRYGADAEKAEIAGLLHDCMKDTSAEKQRCIIAEAGGRLTDCENANENLLHAIAGEAYLRQQILTDEDMLRAVRYHTTGRAGMSRLEQVVYLADFISADRDYPDVETVRSLAQESLEGAMLYTVEFILKKLLREKRAIHPHSVDLYNELLKGRQYDTH